MHAERVAVRKEEAKFGEELCKDQIVLHFWESLSISIRGSAETILAQQVITIKMHMIKN